MHASNLSSDDSPPQALSIDGHSKVDKDIQRVFPRHCPSCSCTCHSADDHAPKGMSPDTEWIYVFAGWILFTLSGAFFTWVAIESADVKSILASFFFLIACPVFLVPVWAKRPFR